MKKNHISILSLKIILFFWGYVYLSTIPINGQTIYYPQTRLLFEHEVGCQTFIEEDVYLTVMESRGKCIKVCQGSEVTYTVEGMPGSSFEWVVIGGSVQNNSSNSFTITWGQGGEGQISITETTVSQISENYLVCIEMIEQPKALFTVQPYSIGTNLYVCKNEEVTFTDLSESDASDILYWAWDFGDETTSAERNPTHRWDREGDFKVILTVTNKCNCSNSFLIEVHVREGAPILIECPSVVCEGVKAVYSIPEGSCTYYIWEVRGGTVDPIQNKNHTAIVWDRPKDLINGFGYLHLFNEFCPNTCQKYSTIKVPVITTTA
ncbi:MAG: PKD domain-containing protein, partial [Bacteroidales bacterium]